MYSYFNNERRDCPEHLVKEFLTKEGSAVITIDMHDGHMSPDPECPCPCPRGCEILKPIDDFTAAARELGVPIIHVRSTLRKGMVDEKLYPSAWRLVFQEFAFKIPNIDEHAIEGTRWNNMSIHVEEGDLMVTGKKRLSAFYPTDLEMLLRNIGVKRVVLVGCMTDCCVLNTAFDAANRDFRVVVAQDLTRGTAELEAPALGIISNHLGLVVESKDLIEEWKTQA